MSTEELNSKICELTNKINDIINKIIDIVIVCSPIHLLSYTSHLELMAGSIISPNNPYKYIEHFSFRLTEYIQHLISIYGVEEENINTEKENENFETILQLCEKLSEITHEYIFTKARLIDKEQNNSTEMNDYFIGQFLYKVRGSRYSRYEKEYMMVLLEPHNEIINKLFGMPVESVVNQMMKLIKSVTVDKLYALNDLQHFEKYIEKYESSQQLNDEEAKHLINVFTNLFSEDTYNVEKITGWPKIVLNHLSSSCQSKSKQQIDDEFINWPIGKPTIFDKPFICYKDEYYYFDRYALADNTYRYIEKTIKALDAEYDWNAVQSKTAENITAKIFHQLIPDSNIFTNNYFNDGENDLLIRFEKTLIIVEIKSNALTDLSPLDNLEIRKKSYKQIIDAPAKQCNKVVDYIRSSKPCVFYDSNNKSKRNKKFQINKENFNHIIPITLSVDDVNAVASNPSNINILENINGVISLCLNDLMIYRDVFENPYEFLHYLRIRHEATFSDNININDELDHLALYIKYRNYPKIFNKKLAKKIEFKNLRNSIDWFFDYGQDELDLNRDLKKTPKCLVDIFNFVNKDTRVDHKNTLFNLLLDFNEDCRYSFEKYFTRICKKQKDSKVQQPFSLISDNDYTDSVTFFIYNPFLHKYAAQETWIPYIMNKSSLDEMYVVEIGLDEQNNISMVGLSKINRGSKKEKT